MKLRTTILGLAVLAALSPGLTGCGPDKAAGGSPPASSAPAGTPSTAATSAGSGADSAGLDGITFPPGATVTDLGATSKQYAVTGMSLEQVKDFFEAELTGKGYVRAQELSASRFYDKGSHRIQVTWAELQGTIRGVVRVLR